METKISNRLGIYIMLGFVALAVAIPVSVERAAASKRTVTVKGLCEKEVEANQVIWPIVYKQGGNDLKALAATVSAKNDVVVEWLKASGIKADEITVSAPKVEDTRTNSYNENRTYNYILTSVITICTDKVKSVIALQSSQFDLLDQGIAIGTANAWDYPTVYSYTLLNDIKPAMIEEATVNAREAAQKFAKDSKSKLGKINDAQQGQFTVSDRDANTPYIKTVRVVTTVKYSLKD